ncbi:MAG: adenylyl-sulfate kinase, partial [Colwellia sp.]
MNNNITWHEQEITIHDREKRLFYKPITMWMTGLSGAGKSTIAQIISKQLHIMHINAYVLDGDNIRHGLCSNLGFSSNDRKENVRRISEMAKILNDAGVMVVCPVISPFEADRLMAKEIISEDNFVEIFCNCDLETCENRDPKGLYKLARQELIKNFTGISSPYQEPENPNIIINTSIISAHNSAKKILNYIKVLTTNTYRME